jgi:hypothetical protein
MHVTWIASAARAALRDEDTSPLELRLLLSRAIEEIERLSRPASKINPGSLYPDPDVPVYD